MKTMKMFDLSNSINSKNRFLLKNKSPNKKRSVDLKSALNFEFNSVPPLYINSFDFDAWDAKYILYQKWIFCFTNFQEFVKKFSFLFLNNYC
jgi:hypothetical protein